MRVSHVERSGTHSNPVACDSEQGRPHCIVHKVLGRHSSATVSPDVLFRFDAALSVSVQASCSVDSAGYVNQFVASLWLSCLAAMADGATRADMQATTFIH